MDNTRLITAALDTQTRRKGVNHIEDLFGEFVDVIGINSYCGWYGGTPTSCSNIKWESEYNKPVIMSEFGAGALQGNHGNEIDRWTEEYQDAVYINNIEMLKNIEFLAGTSPWILMDFLGLQGDTYVRFKLTSIEKDSFLNKVFVKKLSIHLETTMNLSIINAYVFRKFFNRNHTLMMKILISSVHVVCPVHS